jgi:hypothetical protein
MTIVNLSNPSTQGGWWIRSAMLVAASKSMSMAAVTAREKWGTGNPASEYLEKAAVSAGSTTDSTWAAPLSEAGTIASEILGLIRQRSVLGQLGLVRVPFNIALIRQLTDPVAYWIGQGKPKGVSKLTVEGVAALAPKKLTSIVAVTRELLRFGHAESEALFRESLLNAVVTLRDATFLGSSAGTADTPPGIGNGLTPVAGSANADVDLSALIGNFGGDLETSYLVMPGKLAAAAAGLSNPNLSARGGEAHGLPVLVSKSCPTGTVYLIDSAGVAVAELPPELDSAEHAAIEMVDAATSPPTASTILVSLWQLNWTAFRVEQHVNWQVARSGAVSVLTGATWT